MLSLQKQQKIKQELLQNINKINEDLNLIDYTINSLIEENDIANNSEIINEMYELGISIEDKLNSLETTMMFKSKEDAYDAYIDIQSG